MDNDSQSAGNWAAAARPTCDVTQCEWQDAVEKAAQAAAACREKGDVVGQSAVSTLHHERRKSRVSHL